MKFVSCLLAFITLFLASFAEEKLKIGVLKKAEDCPIKARSGDVVSVHYTGKLLDGTVFDSSVERGNPIKFPLGVGQVIKGWDQGILGMCVGEKRKLTIPPALGYGKSGAGSIPPDSTLIFTTELMDIHRPGEHDDFSFNPPTIAHERIAEISRQYGNVLLMLSVMNADKPTDKPQNLQHRVNMMQRMSGCSDLDICLIKSPLFIDKLKLLLSHENYAKITFVMGSDTLIRLVDPKYYPDGLSVLKWFFAHCDILCISRNGYQGPKIDASLNANVKYINVEIPVSSTLARTQMKESDKSDLVSEKVGEYIRENDLYR